MCYSYCQDKSTEEKSSSAELWLICYSRESQELTWLKPNLSGEQSSAHEPNHALPYGRLLIRTTPFLRLRNIPRDVRNMQEDFWFVCLLFKCQDSLWGRLRDEIKLHKYVHPVGIHTATQGPAAHKRTMSSLALSSWGKTSSYHTNAALLAQRLTAHPWSWCFFLPLQKPANEQRQMGSTASAELPCVSALSSRLSASSQLPFLSCMDTQAAK